MKTQSSPLAGSAVAAWVHFAPWLVDLNKSVPPLGVVSYSSPLPFAAMLGSPPYGPTFARLYNGALLVFAPALSTAIGP